jgi:CHAD domain-containing protein
MGSGKSLIIGLFAVIAGATLGIGGAVALMLMELNRYSPAGEILVTMGAFATGLALIMLGLNLLIKQEIGYTVVSAILYAIIIGGFISLYPEKWIYPNVSYIAMGYLATTLFLITRIFKEMLTHLLEIKQHKLKNNPKNNSFFIALAQLIMMELTGNQEEEDQSKIGGEYIMNQDDEELKVTEELKEKPIEIAPDEETEDTKKSKNKNEIQTDDTMAEAARKIFQKHFKKMQKHEMGTKVGRDIEELHDMRVAAMRIKAGFEVLNPYLDMKELGVYLKGIKRTRKALGNVRDMDVFLERIDHYCDELPEERKGELDFLKDNIEIERAKERGNMLEYLDGKRYNRFKKKFEDALGKKKYWKMENENSKGTPRPTSVREVFPTLVYGQYANVLAYEDKVGPDPHEAPLEVLHRLRIDVKILRYTFEFFQEVLGEEAKQTIKRLKSLQDNLGDMHDAAVAVELLNGFKESGHWGDKSTSDGEGKNNAVDGHIDAFIHYKEEEIKKLRDEFPAEWESITGPEFGKMFAESIAGMYSKKI